MDEAGDIDYYKCSDSEPLEEKIDMPIEVSNIGN